MATKLKVVKDKGKGPIEYPKDHQPGMKVTKPGSSCNNCFFWDGKDCENENYRTWNNGSGEIPVEDPETYCSDWWTPRKK